MTIQTCEDTPRVALARTPLLGKLYSDWLSGPGPLSEVLSPRLDPAEWVRPEGLRADPARLDAFWKSCLEMNRRLGASPRALELGRAMASGQADAVVAGQQPGLLGGPLFSLYKLGAAVATAERATEKRGRPVGAIFWIASDDTDFPEIRGARVGRELEMPGAVLPDAMHAVHRMVGSMDASATARVGRELLDQAGGQGGDWVREAWGRASARGVDFGEICAAFFFELLPDWPFLVVDARCPELRAASLPVFSAYLDRREQVLAALKDSGRWLQELGHDPRIEPRSGESSLYHTHGDIRDRWEFPSDPAAAYAALVASAGAISANVVLRPLAQDTVLPVLAQVVGPGEAAYLVQVRRVAEALGAPRPALFPRLSMSLWPREAASLVLDRGVEPAELLTDYDRLLRAHFAEMVPLEVRSQLEGFGLDLRQRSEVLAAATRPVDPSLRQLIESSRSKMDFQLGRLAEGIASKVKSRHDRQNPRLGRLKGFLLPGEKLQERTLSVAAAFAGWGPGGAGRILGLARRHVEDTLAGKAAHYLPAWED